ncbi:hypothetical protein M3B46_08455 [Sphingobacterium daejeonense]|uniref:hypothetical protein n=1 Tax=Sphingobacterium TaxID=28453 RepID=UPI000B944508|nr:hypothetical protein [Sphingobacterium daejeonense]MCT1531022.1 hypothetical protein [Sphingobacterium daejeonense]OYD41438.1 hypothetical protein CHT99_12255 [Sphingobacterium cellulitidis]
MIYIDIENFIPDDDWLYEAWLLNAELKAKISKEEKNQFIDENRAFWGRIKNQLPYNDKCWYSESKESVSVYEIEHFRPTKATIRSKSVLKSLKTFKEEIRKDWIKETKFRGGGYWWLAFNYKNYRNCGKRINNIKGIRFPLQSLSLIAYEESENYLDEKCLLLDPTKEGDPDLLTFDPDGKARPTLTDGISLEFIRAHASIDIYGLNAIEPLVKHRESKWNECYKAIKRATEKYTELELAADEGNMNSFKRYFDEFIDFIENDIKPAIHPSSEFSAVAKACVISYSKYGWISEYVLTE